MTSAWQILLLFFAISFIIYHLISAKIRWIFLLIVSLIFLFVVSGPLCFVYTLIFVSVSYFGAYYISKTDTERTKTEILILTVVVLFLGLLLFKLTNVIVPVNVFISKFFNIPKNFVNDIIVPVGISYYTLILIAYVTDVYRKVTTFEKNFFKYLLFSIYFPQLLMGPIVRHSDTKEQLFSTKPIEFSCIQYGIIRILWGIAKKIVIADRIAIVVNSIFGNYTAYPSCYLVLGIVLFGVQFYADFSAAMDIVLGISECLGIKLPENFRNPFFSTSFHQYWQRWHITIFTFYRDYIFYPVLRSKPIMALKKYLEKSSNLNSPHIPIFISYIVVWLFAGVWHGADSKALFGNCFLPCMYLIFTDLIHDYTKKLYKKYKFLQKNLIYRIFQMIGVYILLCFCWIFFVAQTMSRGFLIIFKSIFEFQFDFNISIAEPKDIYIIITGFILILVVDIIKENKISIEKFYTTKLPVIFHWCAITILLAIIFWFGLYGPNYDPTDFVYFRF